MNSETVRLAGVLDVVLGGPLTVVHATKIMDALRLGTGYQTNLSLLHTVIDDVLGYPPAPQRAAITQHIRRILRNSV